jgi:transposase
MSRSTSTTTVARRAVRGSPASRNHAVAPAEHRLTAAQWAAIRALLPPQARTGRPRADDRQTIAAILYRLETRCAWRSIPAAFGAGATAHRRLQAWQAAGVWARIAAILRDSRTEALRGVQAQGEGVAHEPEPVHTENQTPQADGWGCTRAPLTSCFETGARLDGRIPGHRSTRPRGVLRLQHPQYAPCHCAAHQVVHPTPDPNFPRRHSHLPRQTCP